MSSSRLFSLFFLLFASLNTSKTFGLGIQASLNATLKLNFNGESHYDVGFSTFIAQMCTPGTLDTFRSPAHGERLGAYSCQIYGGEIPSIPGGTSVLIRTDFGGYFHSDVEVGDLMRGIDLARCSDPDNDRIWDCLGDHTQYVNVPAHVGLWEVEPELYAIPANGGAYKPPFYAENVAAMSVTPLQVRSYGVVVTPDLRNALQAAQGLVVGSDDVANMPSLSSALIANIFTARMANWGTLVDSTGTGINTTAVKTNSDAVEVCMHYPSSGTQALLNAFYLGNSCLYSGASNFVFVGFSTPADGNGRVDDIQRRQIGPVLVPPPYIHHNYTSISVGKCMTNIAAANRTAIGFQPMEEMVATIWNNFKYIGVDGVAPTLENIQAGLYRNWNPVTAQWREDLLSYNQVLAAEYFVRVVQQVEIVKNFNYRLKGTGVWAGIPTIFDANDISGRADVGRLAFAGAGYNSNIEDGWDDAKPLFAFHKGTNFGEPSSCAVPRLVRDQKVDVSYTN